MVVQKDPSQVMNLLPASAVRTPSAPSSIQNSSATPATKSKMCTKYNTAEGCKFGDKCHFAHGAWELGKPIVSSQEPIPSCFGNHIEPPPRPAPGVAASFGASATAKISVDASLAGAIIGKGGVNSKQICRQTGVKLAIRDHESDANLRNIELEGTFEQIKEASGMVRELIVSVSSTTTAGARVRPAAASGPPMSNYKTKLCENFAKGCCTFGERCHFAHGNGELRKSGVM
ncbi:zinc finger CCCH domain-containing protein 31-like isoform X3 [Cynara cardunculus var. scolymus]|uniref:zinc finger CCCH domain-containing protein 31-like isoform X3 n=1 Tax=Cynara cardunculus var. scolymus TaxID=59895 RepID=UPI000D62D943|nr:zinc finger CCCH domain-containing protein 31-like isoform X3 [Cynara cardunculus var. scolymus]